MKKFEHPALIIEKIEVEDVITASNICDPDCPDFNPDCPWEG